MLTDAKIAGLKAAPGKPVEHADTIVPGLRLRVSAKTKTWLVRARMAGTVRTITIGTYGHDKGEVTLAAARIAAAEILEKARAGAPPLPQSPRRTKTKTRTVSESIELFLTYCADDRGMKHPDAYRQMLTKYVVPAIGAWELQAVTKADIKDIIGRVRDASGMTTARRVGGVMKRLFRWAAEEDMIPSDPGATVRLPGREVQRERTLSDAEIKALWRVTDPTNDPQALNKAGRVAGHPSQWPWGPFIRLSLLLGQRRGEIASMRWSAIDTDAGTWAMTSAETKSARPQLVPLPVVIVDLLADMPRYQGCDFVFTTSGRGPIRTFSKCKAMIDAAMIADMEVDALPHWQLHDLRRTCSTNLARLKVDPFIRRRVLNHALEGVDKVYDHHDYLDEKRAALDLWAGRVSAIVNGGGPDDQAEHDDAGNVVQFKRGAKA